MYKKGDRFVIQIDKVVTDGDRHVCLYKIKGFNTLVFDDYGLGKLEQQEKGRLPEYARGYLEGLVEGRREGRKRERERIIAILEDE